MIVLRREPKEKTFSKPDYDFGTSHSIGIVQQLVKLMNIYSGVDAEQNFKHWIKNLQGAFIRPALNSVKNKNLRGGYQSLLILNEDEDRIMSDTKLRDLFGVDLLTDIKGGKLKCGDNFAIEGIKSAEGEAGMKYRNHFTNLERDKDFIGNLRTLLRYIALRLSGQIGQSEDFWTATYKEVDYTRPAKVWYTEDQIRKIMIQSLIKYFEAMGLDYSETLHEYE